MLFRSHPNTMFVHEVCIMKKRNQDKSTEIYPPLLLIKPSDILVGAHAMPESQKVQQNVPIIMKTTGLCPSGSFYSMIYESKRGLDFDPQRSQKKRRPIDSGMYLRN